MARRFRAAYQAEPYSALAIWAWRLAVFSAVATLVSVVAVRVGILESKPALATLLGALACAGLSMLVAFAGLVALWRDGSRGIGYILAAMLLNVLILAYPAYLAVKYRNLPPIHDITTDPVNPPRFDALARLRDTDGANSAVYAGLYSAEQQRAAYPAIEPVELEVTAQQAFDIVRRLIARRKWLVIDERPPQPPQQSGHIEAVAKTPVMGFREDVVIRITQVEDGSLLDIRSSSRYFEHDLGSNAARVSSLIDDINIAAEKFAAKAAKESPVPVKPPARGAVKR